MPDPECTAVQANQRPRLHHRLDGRGPRVLFLHPVGLDLHCFEPLVGELEERFTVLRVDLRGHGKSPSGPPAPALQDYAEDVHALLADIGFLPTAVVGFSFGGMIAQLLALDHPEDVSALVIAACASTLEPDGRRILAERGTTAERHGMGAVIDATTARWFSPEFLGRGDDRDVRDQLGTMAAGAWADAWRAMSTIDAAARLQEIAVPTLCLAGGADQSAPPDTLLQISRRITGSRFEVVAGAPHMLFIEQHREVAAILDDFLCRAAASQPTRVAS
jgi:3-oxoadipate enol-lactonase